MFNERKVTEAQVVERFRQMPEMRKLVKDCYWDEDFIQAAKRFYRSEEFAAVTEYISYKNVSPPGLVLDLGGGNGIASLAFYWLGYHVVLVEPDNSDVVGLGVIAPFSKQGKYHIRLCAAMGESLPFSKNTFDVVYARQVLHHLTDLDAACAEVHRVLKPKGVFIATREHVISRPSDLSIFLENHPLHRYTGEENAFGENAFLLREYRNALKRAGFKNIRVLGPLDSVINYYPLSCSQYADICRPGLEKYVGARLGRYLAARRVVLKLYVRYLKMRDHAPGRPYSFIAVH